MLRLDATSIAGFSTGSPGACLRSTLLQTVPHHGEPGPIDGRSRPAGIAVHRGSDRKRPAVKAISARAESDLFDRLLPVAKIDDAAEFVD